VATDLAKDEVWQLAATAVASFGVDWDARRRAFHREPAYRVRAVVLLVLSERHLPGYDAEETIEDSAAERSAEIYDAERRSGELERSGKIVKRAVFGLDAAA
jgi:hypothetical protein